VEVHLEQNELRHLPSELSEIRTLRSLTVNHNRFDNVSRALSGAPLPELLAQLTTQQVNDIQHLHGVPQCTRGLFEGYYRNHHLMHHILAKWSATMENKVALMELIESPALSATADSDSLTTKVTAAVSTTTTSTDGNSVAVRTMTWSELDRQSSVYALKLLQLKVAAGDIVALLSPFCIEALVLELAAFKIGAVVAPIDCRLPVDRIRMFMRLQGERLRAVAFNGAFENVVHSFTHQSRSIKFLVALSQPSSSSSSSSSSQVIAADLTTPLSSSPPSSSSAPSSSSERASSPSVPILSVASFASAHALLRDAALQAEWSKVQQSITEDTVCLSLASTFDGANPQSTFYSHRNLACAAMCFIQAFQLSADSRLLLGAPGSPADVTDHIQLWCSALFTGACSVLDPSAGSFAPSRALRAIEQHRIASRSTVHRRAPGTNYGRSRTIWHICKRSRWRCSPTHHRSISSHSCIKCRHHAAFASALRCRFAKRAAWCSTRRFRRNRRRQTNVTRAVRRWWRRRCRSISVAFGNRCLHRPAWQARSSALARSVS
jgi:hypothetical protein